ncbi:MAG: hypothetical protein AAGU21_11985 [Solidesulfovibrio sp.]|uniref:hypothetical protein n=1 Tax=Solidesulfovibrio sp. TaxID=2910990 RepID=UPI0031586218
MEPQDLERLDLKSAIISAFRPIEQLFKIMDTTAIEVDGAILRSYSEIGLELTRNFRQKLENLLNSNQDGAENADR